MASAQYKRILLKLSGEALKGNETHGVDPKLLSFLIEQVAEIHALGIEIGVVIGGGNYFRGAQAHWMDRSAADYVGMMATVMNGLTLREAFRQRGLPCSLFSALSIEGVVERYELQAVHRALAAGQIVIFSGGTGHPFFSTDTAAALRAGEIQAQIFLKATQVDGVYDSDPRTHPNAKRYDHIDYLRVLQKDLRVMDATSVSFCREYDIPILVFDVHQPGHLKRAVLGESVGTFIGTKKSTSVEDPS